MNAVVEQYLRSQLESVEYRVTLGTNNVENITEQLKKAKVELAQFKAEAEALRGALPAPTEVPTQVPSPTQGEDQAEAGAEATDSEQ